MKITITIPDIKDDALIEAFASLYKYQDYLDDEQTIINPETKKQFTLRKINEYIKEVYAGYTIKAGLKAEKETLAVDAKAYTDDFTII